MTKVNFYTLASSEDEVRLQFTCRLTEKARSMGHPVFIHTESPQQAKLLDDMLWQFKSTSFIPHELATEAGDYKAKVQIGADLPQGTNSEVLINLSGSACENHQQFSRINEILSSDKENLAQGRSRYRFYQAQGYTPETHKL